MPSSAYFLHRGNGAACLRINQTDRLVIYILVDHHEQSAGVL